MEVRTKTEELIKALKLDPIKLGDVAGIGTISGGDKVTGVNAHRLDRDSHRATAMHDSMAAEPPNIDFFADSAPRSDEQFQDRLAQIQLGEHPQFGMTARSRQKATHARTPLQKLNGWHYGGAGSSSRPV